MKRNPHFQYRLVLSLFFFAMGLIFASWATRIPDIQAALRLNDAELGTALFGAPLGQLPCLLAAGLLVNRFGSRKVLALGLFLYATALLGLGSAGAFWQLFLSLMFFGIGGNLFDIALNTQAVAVERLYGRSIMASLHGLWSLGGVAGGVLGALLAGFGVGPWPHFVAVSILAAGLYFGLRSKLLPDVKPEARRPGEKRPRLIRPDLLVLLLGVVAFGSMATEGTMYDWIAVYYTAVLQAPDELIRAGYIACMSCMVLGRFLADGLITRFGPVRVLQVSGLLMCAGLLLLILQSGLLFATLGAALTGFGMAAGIPICFSLAGKSRTIPPSVAISLVVFVSFSGFLVCPPLIGHLSHAFSLQAAFIPIAGVALVIALLAPLLGLLLKRQSEQTERAE